MHYFHTHFNVYPNPQAKVDARHNQRSANFASSKLGIPENADYKLSGGEDVQQQVHADKSGARPNVGQTEQHTQGHNKVQRVLKVGPLISPIQGFAVAHPKYAVVSQVCDVPEQKQGSIVVIDQDVSVGFEEASHCVTITRS